MNNEVETFSDNTLVYNLNLLANNINKQSVNFRVVKRFIPNTNQYESVIKTNNFIRSLFTRLPCFKSSNEVKLRELFTRMKDHITADAFERSHFFHLHHNHEVRDLFIAVQKFNQVVDTTRDVQPPLIHQVGLQTIYPEISRTFPDIFSFASIKMAASEPVNQDLRDQPIIARRGGMILADQPATPEEQARAVDANGRLRDNYVYRYNAESFKSNHKTEAIRIFLSTQKERLLGWFSKQFQRCGMTCGKRYRYFRNDEDKHGNIRKHDSPLSLRSEPTSYWLGHASCFLSVPISGDGLNNINIITDPVEGDLNRIFYPRQTPFARPMEDLPAVHAFLLSHNHLDHFKTESVQKLLVHQPMMIVPIGDGQMLRDMGFRNVCELRWWEKTKITFTKNGQSYEVQIAAVPANHWAGRGIGGHQSLFAGYVISPDWFSGDIYFAGDTARLSDEHIQLLRENFRIRWMFQPGGPDENRSDLKSTHQASIDGIWMHFKLLVQKAHAEINGVGHSREDFIAACKKMRTIYMHYKTFKLGNLHFDDTERSIERLKHALRRTRMPRGLTPETLMPNEADLKKKKDDLRDGAMKQQFRMSIEEANMWLQHTDLKDYELDVYYELLYMANSDLVLAGQPMDIREILEIIDETVVLPQVGERTAFVA